MDQWLSSAAGVWGETGVGVVPVDMEVPLGVMKMFFKLNVMMAAQTCEYTPKSLSCTFWVNCLVCKFYLNNAVKKFKKEQANILRYH